MRNNNNKHVKMGIHNKTAQQFKCTQREWIPGHEKSKATASCVPAVVSATHASVPCDVQDFNITEVNTLLQNRKADHTLFCNSKLLELNILRNVLITTVQCNDFIVLSQLLTRYIRNLFLTEKEKQIQICCKSLPHPDLLRRTPTPNTSNGLTMPFRIYQHSTFHDVTVLIPHVRSQQHLFHLHFK